MAYPMGIPPTLIRDISKLHPKMQIMVKILQQEWKEAGLGIVITQTYRTEQVQKEYFSWGRSKINPHNKKFSTVTNCDGIIKKSRHQYGLAIDIAVKMHGYPQYDENILKKAGIIAESLGLTWGGRWKELRDTPHIEIPLNKVDSFIIPSQGKVDDEKMPNVSEKEKSYGQQAIKNLAANHVLNSPEQHIAQLDGYMPAWKAWVVLNNIFEQLKNNK